MTWDGGLNNGPKDTQVQISGTCKYVTLYGNRAFAGVTKLRALRQGADQDYQVGINVLPGAFLRGEWRGAMASLMKQDATVQALQMEEGPGPRGHKERSSRH